MPENRKSEGLCTTCRNNADCKLPRTPSKPIVECEEFEIAEARRSGLCVNCADLATCGFPNAGNAVWYCEEYA